MMRLRWKSPEIVHIAHFETVTSALTDSKKSSESGRAAPAKEQTTSTFLVSADDLWDWARGEVSTLARRLLDADELQEFSDNVTGEIRFLAESFESGELLSASLYMMRRRLSCHVNIGPLRDDTGAVEETKRRLSIFSSNVDQLIDGAKTSHDDATIEHAAQD